MKNAKKSVGKALLYFEDKKVKDDITTAVQQLLNRSTELTNVSETDFLWGKVSKPEVEEENPVGRE